MHTITQDNNGWTHLNWELKGVTAEMVNWHWCNLEKDYILWHPEDHRGFAWANPVTEKGFLGAVQCAVQQTSPEGIKDPMKMPFGLKYYDISVLKGKWADLIKYENAILVGRVSNDNWEATPESYILHQWQAGFSGVVGMSSAISVSDDLDPEIFKKRMLGWAAHAGAELENFPKFLPALFNMWQVVEDPEFNKMHSMKVVKTEDGYAYC